jgi:hypothetical protein
MIRARPYALHSPTATAGVLTIMVAGSPAAHDYSVVVDPDAFDIDRTASGRRRGAELAV